MLKRIKEYIQYKRNKRITKKEFVKIGAVVLPAIRVFSEKKSDLLHFVMQLAEESRTMNGEDLFALIIKEVTDKLAADQTR